MEFVASGSQADIYKNDYMAIKLFKKQVPKSYVEYEMNLQKMAFELRLPVPEIYNIVEIEGKHGIVMEYINGVSVGELIFKNQENMQKYLIKSIEIQMQINNIITDKFPLMKDKLIRQIISTKELNDADKDKILKKLNNMLFESKLCHGDFHLFNLLETSKDIKVIDWVDSSSGSVEADICRTYLLYKIINEVLAEIYIENYCKISGVSKENIMNWLPYIAAARLSEGRDDKENKMLKDIVNEIL